MNLLNLNSKIRGLWELLLLDKDFKGVRHNPDEKVEAQLEIVSNCFDNLLRAITDLRMLHDRTKHL